MKKVLMKYSISFKLKRFGAFFVFTRIPKKFFVPLSQFLKQNKMKILVIHPNDASTDFLCPIYLTNTGRPRFDDVTIFRGGQTMSQIREAIQTHDQVIMMGHGSPYGLFSMGMVTDLNTFGRSFPYVIDFNTVDLLKQKDNNIFIWCNADQFVTKHQLKGFYTGMFISETGEATYCGLPGTSQETVDESNNGFVKIFSEALQSTHDTNLLFEQTNDQYSLIAGVNPVAKYNYNRLYCK